MLIHRQHTGLFDPAKPQLGIFREEFGLDDADYNPWLATRLLADNTYAEHALPPQFAGRWMTGKSRLHWLWKVTKNEGRIFLLSTRDGAEPAIIHHLRFNKAYVRWLKTEVIHHVKLWTRWPAPSGFHTHLLLDELLAPRRIIQTDGLYADDSASFWYARFSDAQQRSIPLAMADDVHQLVQPFDSKLWEKFRDNAREKGRHFTRAHALIGYVSPSRDECNGASP